ncbi:S8 family peptidase [Bacillus sp. FJAT-49736]|uniref:S8 family peptidase n=1 Tax=Bacillus sp. FJAT-49736 TaxID=2833582 RepID=UPI001BC9B952|nr:S8 family peptidase [Bacillus sp. FJAT-49736]MBS4174443.1 S8 family serine peptidase [Bacillus sp. FJAT-49736]MBS4175800.1 S8 family serine peptidase [Bacillus sp. FJAT-49736]
MLKKKRLKKTTSILATVLLSASLIAPSFSNAATVNGKPYTSVFDGKNVASAKLSDRLLKQFTKADEKVTFLIKFKEQADTTKAAKAAADKASKGKLSAQKTKLAKRSAVVSELRSTALETQHTVIDYLEKEKKNGKVKDFESFYIVNGIAVTATKDIAEKLSHFEEVAKILPNEIRQLYAGSATQSSEAKGSLAVGKTAEQPKANTNSIEWNINKIGAPQVWSMGIDGTGTVVANIDTGVQWDHPALKEKYRGYNPSNPNTPNNEMNWFDATAGRSTPYDDQGHGTHTMGTMVGSEPNGSNQIGVAPGAKWIAVKAFTAAGGTDADLLRAGEWIISPKDAAGNPHPDKAPDVVNNSWGGGPGLDEWYRDMVKNWRDAEIFPEFSAGNTDLWNPGGPGSVANPANYPESFATGATDINNKLASFSLQGPSPYGEIKPEVSAPGVNIRSSVPGGVYEGGWNGTSMAGPHVSAVVALLKQANASLTVNQIEDILISTATPLTDSTFPNSPNNGYGYGLVNAFDAVSSVLSGLGTVKGQVGKDGNDTEPPTFTHTAPTETYAGMDLTLNVTVSDNVSVASVKLQYQDKSGNWQNVDATRTSGDYKSGEYQVVVPGNQIAVPSLKYRWKINDFGNNEVTSNDYQVSVKPGITVGYSQDFESTPIGWYSYGTKDSWQWGIPTSGPNSAASGQKVYATNLAGNYDNSANMTLVMPPIDLPAGNAYLQFKNWFDLETRYDFGTVFVSNDLQNWTQLLQVNGQSGGWVDQEVNLSNYSGGRIYIGFNVKTDGSVQKAGWYLDDVKLSATPKNSSGTKNTGKLGVGQSDDKDSLKKEKVDPASIKPELPKKDAPPAKEEQVNPTLLPMGAQVSVLETGRSVMTNPANGQYQLSHAAGSYTLQAEAYGYQSEQQRVNIERDGVTTANFVLHELAKGHISGTVKNKSTGEPLQGATLLLVEDAAVTPVQTDANGHYDITAYAGNYTLKVLAPYYHSQDIAVTVNGNTTTEKNIDLVPIISYPGGEIGYDDGTAENAHAFYDAGNGWAVKMSLPEGKKTAIVTAGVFRFWTSDWPTPGGTDFKVEVWDASGTGGAPGKKIAGPINAKALRNGEWTVVDLSTQGIVVNGDFYMVYIQTNPNPNAPGLATDESGTNAKRSWQLVGGAWSQSPADEGNYMIRARVSYEVDVPVITSPKDGTFTNEGKVTVEGTASPTTDVNIYNNGTKVASTKVADNGKFSAEVALSEGDNVLTAKSSVASGSTDASAPVKVVYDKTNPTLTIDSPKNNDKTNRETVTVEGKVNDANLDFVKVNGEKATVTDGKYSKRILLEEGQNDIKVVAQDKAGNKVSKKVTVFAKYTAPEIKNLMPNTDKNLKTGDSVKIEFDSEPGLKATFAIHMPLTNVPSSDNATELPMMETSAGHYVGYWTVPSKTKADGAVVEVKVVDDYSNVSTKLAAGKLYIQ